MAAGSRRYLVTLQQPDLTGSGGYADVAQVWADMQFQPAGGVPITAGGPSAQAAHRVRIRFRSDVRSDWRLTVDGRTFQIVGYGDPDGRRRELMLVCLEVE